MMLEKASLMEYVPGAWLCGSRSFMGGCFGSHVLAFQYKANSVYKYRLSGGVLGQAV